MNDRTNPYIDNAARFVWHKDLDKLVDFINQYYSMSDEERSNKVGDDGEAYSTANFAVGFIGNLLGRELLLKAYMAGSYPGDATRDSRLIGNRLAFSQTLFSSIFPTDIDELSPSSIIEEIEAVAHGDAAKLIRRGVPRDGAPSSQGSSGFAYRLACLQLRAFEWEAYLRNSGTRTLDRHVAIAQAFDVDWDTIRKWKAPCRMRIGPVRFDRAVRLASRQGTRSYPFGDVRLPSWEDRLNADGAQYRKLNTEKV